MSRIARATLIAFGTAFAFSPLTEGAIWHSGFDPAGQVTFSGQGTFQFDNACLGLSGSVGATFCHLQLLGASLNLTDSSTGNNAQLNFGPQVINGLPTNAAHAGAVFAAVLNDLSGSTPGLVLSTTTTLGAQQGNGTFAVAGLKVVASTSAIANLQFSDLSNLIVDATNFTLSGSAPGTFVGGHGGIHNFLLTFNANGTWTFQDFTSGTTETGTYAAVVSLNFQGGALTGLNTGLIGPEFVTDGSSSLFGPWSLEWDAGVTDPVSLFTETCNANGCSEVVVGTDTHVTFTEVSGPSLPEPATLGLVLGAAGAAWLSRRRRAATD